MAFCLRSGRLMGPQANDRMLSVRARNAGEKPAKSHTVALQARGK